MLAGPLAIIAEVTHRCPLRCVYCSNPLELKSRESELSTADWLRVFEEAAALKALHVHLTGGEPLARLDLEQLLAGAHQAGLYTNLITSGIPLTGERLARLVAAGLDHIQLSFQADESELAQEIAGRDALGAKLKLVKEIHAQNIAFTANLVVHRRNLDRLDSMLSFIEALQPQRIEIAHVQYYGWAFANRAGLLPTRAQLELAQQRVAEAVQRTHGRIRIDYVVPDYYARFPKACMGGWGQRMMLITPDGKALPCHAAEILPGLEFANVRDHALSWIWQESEGFRKYRGEDWMQEPCRTCEHRSQDFGGCRCQAFVVAGNASAADPVCHLSPERALVDTLLRQVGNNNPELVPLWTYRINPS